MCTNIRETLFREQYRISVNILFYMKNMSMKNKVCNELVRVTFLHVSLSFEYLIIECIVVI